MKRICFVQMMLLTLAPTLAWSGESLSVQHSIVAIEKDRFHGWPANNGVWQWGNEILVAFTQGDFELHRGHNIAGRQDTLLSRSKDGGETWEMFDPEGFLDDDNEKFKAEGKKALSEPMDFNNPGFALRIFATGYHGNDDPDGGFFYSYDRGQTWNGPYSLNGLNDHPEIKGKKLSPRTDYVIQDGKHCRVFISAEDPEIELARLACIETTDGGRTFDFVSWITPEAEDYRAIMCQTVQVSDDHFVTAYRKIYQGGNKLATIEAYESKDGCKTWDILGTVKTMKTHSNPPALVKLEDGRLCCAYGDRHVGEMRARYSADNGKTWGPEFIIRDDFQPMDEDPDVDEPGRKYVDLGYPRLVQRPDGKLVVMYYWATEEHPQQFIGASIWKP
ncbi:MAG: exo-alpha-sialidase [Candidatus Omnitrophica bacterium]|nr:exo-alpha-sialidase [Candidatus Omnitrophota bacterium]